MLAKTLVAAALLVAGAPAAHAGPMNNELNQQWASFRDQTSAQFSAKFTEMSAAGYRMIDVDAYPNGSGILYSQIWERTPTRAPGPRTATCLRRRSIAAMHSSRGRAIACTISKSYRIGSTQRYAAIWIANTEGWITSFAKDLTSAQYGAYFTPQRDAGRRPVDVEVYATPGGLRYAAIWYQNAAGTPWVQLRDMSRALFRRRSMSRAPPATG